MKTMIDEFNFHPGRVTKSNRLEDICNFIRIFYDVIGGKERYQKHSDEVKYICFGLKPSLILKKFPTGSDLRVHLETQAWSQLQFGKPED